MKKISVVLVLCLICGAAYAEEVKIVDGDSLELNGERVRLDGIDAPEYFQVCRNEQNKEYECGQEALQYLQNLSEGQSVTCNCLAEKDKYGRKLCECFVGNLSLNKEMVRSGWAFPYRDDDKYSQELEYAQTQHIGIWQGKNMRPALYRVLEKIRSKKTDL